LRFLKRRHEWRLGRWTTKNAVLLSKFIEQDFAISEIEILPKESGAPVLLIKNKSSNINLSISHREEKALCIISESAKSIGCDLEFIEHRSEAFINDYFTNDEKNLFIKFDNVQKDLLANLIWSAKESASKVLEVGLNMDTRDINVPEIEISENTDWKDLKIFIKNSSTFYSKWLQLGNYILTISSQKSFITPIKL